jgi:hypothetical protein
VPVFRQDAAVHFVVLTDSPSDDADPNEFGVSGGIRSPFGFHHTLGDMLQLLSRDGIHPNPTEANYVSDATITFLGGTDYLEGTLDSFDETIDPYFGMSILGVDINVEDEWNADARAYDFVDNEAIVFVYDGSDAMAVEVTDDFTTAGPPGQEIAYGFIHQNLLSEDFFNAQ